MKILNCILLFHVGFLCCYGQIKKTYSFPGEYNRKSAQGMAIHKNSAFLLNNEGYCRIYDLKKKKLISEFDLASAGKENHANSASFGADFPKGNKKYPAIYISQCMAPSYCYVENITEKGSQLIQTLQIRSKGIEQYSCNWIVDSEQKYIYTMASLSGEIDSIGTRIYLITKLPLPPLDSTSFVFTEKDIVDQFEILFPNLLQGGTIKNNYLYLPVGVHDYPGSESRKDKHRALIIVNLITKQIERTIDINDSVLEEPEDVDFYKNELLLYCGQEGGLYRLPVKE